MGYKIPWVCVWMWTYLREAQSVDFKDPVRRLINDRAAELGITHAELSRAIGKGVSYVNQYLRRGSPVYLDERERKLVANALKLDEAALICSGSEEPSSTTAVARAQVLARSTRHIPVFREDSGIDFEQVSEWIDRPDFVSLSEKSFAIWIYSDHGRLVHGDLAFVTGGQPPRPEGLAIALSLDQRGIVAIGVVTELTADRITIDTGDGKPKSLPRRGYVILKIAASRYA